MSHKPFFIANDPMTKINNIIAVASGKGGVGKSTTAVNIAAALSQTGASVALLDADIYGPNQPHLLGTNVKPAITENKKFEPVVVHGMKTMSIGYLVDNNTAMIWRGPMVSAALKQLFFDTLWGEVDYLILDLPPGTGDIQLTMSQKIPVTAAVVVTTPQDLAMLDARKAVEMFTKVDVPVAGVVENMATHICSQCGHQEATFGHDGAQMLAKECELPILGSLPLDISIRKHSDAGVPVVLADPESEIAKTYVDIAKQLQVNSLASTT